MCETFQQELYLRTTFMWILSIELLTTCFHQNQIPIFYKDDDITNKVCLFDKQTRLKLIAKKRNSFLVETCGEQLTYDGPRLWIAHTVSFDWFLSGFEWILNLEFCLVKLLIFYRKFIWDIRSRLNPSIFWVFEPVFKRVWSKSSFFVQKASILMKNI